MKLKSLAKLRKAWGVLYFFTISKCSRLGRGGGDTSTSEEGLRRYRSRCESYEKRTSFRLPIRSVTMRSHCRTLVASLGGRPCAFKSSQLLVNALTRR